MKTFLLAGVVALCLAPLPPAAAAAGSQPQPAANGSPAHGSDDHVQTFPSVTGSDPAAARINAALARATLSLQRAIGACHHDAADSDAASGWTRTVAVTMDGPDYLSLVTEDSVFCGGAHPDFERSALVYDRRTGSPVNWLRLLPPSCKATGTLGGSLSGSAIGVVMSPPMLDLYRRLYPARLPDVDDNDRQACLDSIEDGFVLWPDSSRHALLVQPIASAHATAACAVPVALSPALLRSLGGVDTRLADALAARR